MSLRFTALLCTIVGYPIIVFADMPTAMGPFEIGQQIRSEDHYTQGRFEGLDGDIEAVTDLSGNVTHVVLYHYDSSVLAGFTHKMSKDLGAPQVLGSDEWDRSYVWKSGDGGRALRTLLREPCCGAEPVMVVILETTNPHRLCGPQDGFREFLGGMQQAIETRDYDTIASTFQYPFVQFQILQDPDYETAPNARIDFLTQGALRSHLGSHAGLDNILRGISDMNPEGPDCVIAAVEGDRRGYSTDAYFIGGIAFERTAKGWSISETFYVP